VPASEALGAEVSDFRSISKLERSDFYVRQGKRILDVVLSSVILLLSAPLMGIVALLIVLDSRGSPIFTQARVGKNGTRFKCYKFRTMYVDNDDTIHRQHIEHLLAQNHIPGEGESLKLKNDHRITRVGAFLRRTSLDELPQFFNVLRGNMSIVGPRPEVPYALAAYKPLYYERFQATPGITGYWQVIARNQVSYEQMIQMDIEYYYRQNLWFDLALMLKTPLAMIKGKGAG
jgi:lipopolysaccharide/colanic/teichoic acid biosynthesis glycosyltransferase